MNEQEKKDEVVDLLLQAYKKLCLLNGQGINKPQPRNLANIIRALAPGRARLEIITVHGELRTVPSAPRQAVPGKPSEARPTRQAEASKVEGPEIGQQEMQELRKSLREGLRKPQVEPAAVKSEAGEVVAGANPLTDDETLAAVEMKPADAVEQFGEARLFATLAALDYNVAGKSGRQLHNMLKKHYTGA